MRIGVVMLARAAKVLLAGALLAVIGAGPARAFDHLDAPGVVADPSTDITDLFAWMSSDATTVNLVMTVFPGADDLSKFSGAAAYVFHTASQSMYGSGPAVPLDVICTFAQGAVQSTSCWVGTQDYVTGDASSTSGLVSASGHVQVFAGLRDDPAFVNLDGLRNFNTAIFGAMPATDAAGCPSLGLSTSAALVGILHNDANGTGPGTNFFLGQNVLALVVSIDASLLTTGGPIVSVWGSTNQL